MVRKLSLECHEILAELYSQYPYVTVDTKRTRDLWRRIEELEAQGK